MTTLIRAFCKIGIAIVLLLTGGLDTASAQFFNFDNTPQRSNNNGFGGGFFGGGDVFAPFREAPLPRRRVPRRVQVPRPAIRQTVEDYSKAPLPEGRETAPERRVLVLGDGMADWLAFGLEEAYAEQPVGVIRKIKSDSGLIKYQTQGDPGDWTIAAKSMLAIEKPDAIVVLLGLNDRVSIREPAAEKSGKKINKNSVRGANSSDAEFVKTTNTAVGSPENNNHPELSSEADAVENSSAQPRTTPEKTTRSSNGVYDFRSERWVELYTKKIDRMIRQLKTKGIPILWVGLPAIRGMTANSDIQYLNSLYRDAAAKTGIAYVDVWDGFVDEGGRFLSKGPDLEGQIRQLRSNDGVYFTKSGARKLAHYVERDIAQLLAALFAPATLPAEPATPGTNALPGQPAPRPLSGPILPLVELPLISDHLLGGPDMRPVIADTLAARTLLKGKPLAPPAGRADDSAWPRREPGSERIRDETPLAAK